MTFIPLPEEQKELEGKKTTTRKGMNDMEGKRQRAMEMKGKKRKERRHMPCPTCQQYMYGAWGRCQPSVYVEDDLARTAVWLSRNSRQFLSYCLLSWHGIRVAAGQWGGAERVEGGGGECVD